MLVPVLSVVVVTAVLVPVGIWVARSRRSSQATQKLGASTTVVNPTQSASKTAKVISSHTASSDEEISVKTGEVVTILDANEDDFWIVEIDGKVGLVPSACLAA